MNLLDIVKKHMELMMRRGNQVETSDFREFYDYVEKYSEIDISEVKPYLVIIHGNMWEVFHDLMDDAMEYLGYEYIGRMGSDFQDDDKKYIFKCEDETYDMLFRLKSPYADYTKTFKF